MKKILILVCLSAFAFAGCGGKETTTPQMTNKCYQGAPDWVINGGAEGGLSGVGAAKIGAAGNNFARTMAKSSALDDMARTLNVKVNNMLKTFTQSTGIGDDEVVDTVSASVSKQLTSQELQGAKQSAIWVSECDEIYVLMVIDPNTIQDYVKSSVTSSYRNENALWQQFQAQKAQDELDSAIAQEFGR